MGQSLNNSKDIRLLLNKMLEQVEPVNFNAIVNENSNGDVVVRNRHYHVISIDKMLSIAKENNWGLCRDNDFIYVYNGEFWNRVDEQLFKRFLAMAASKMGVDKNDAKHYAFQEQLIKQFHTAAFQTKPNILQDTVVINLANGTYEISPRGGKLRGFKSNDFLTYQLPFEFDPSAKAPMFKRYLDQVLPDENLQKVLSEFIGYVFVRNMKLEKCLLLYGSGANGKSVFFEIVNALLGRNNVTNFTLANLSEEHNRALISNKLLNYGSEIRGSIDSDVFKQLVSEEPIQCRMKYGNSFFIENYARLCFNCNELPKEVEHSEAFFRRFIIIPFGVTIPENDRDPELSQRIIDNELSGVFNWVLEGVNRLIKQKAFSKSGVINKTVNEYRQQSDNVHLFLSEEGYEKSNESYILLKNLYPQYKSFCLNDGYRPLSKLNFQKRLEKLGCESDRKNIGIVYFLSNSK